MMNGCSGATTELRGRLGEEEYSGNGASYPFYGPTVMLGFILQVMDQYTSKVRSISPTSTWMTLYTSAEKKSLFTQTMKENHPLAKG